MVAIKVAKGDLNKKTVKFFRDVFLKAEDEVNKASGTVSTNVDSLPSSSSGAVVSVISSGTSMVSASSGSPAITYTVVYASLAVAGPLGSKAAMSILNERIESSEYAPPTVTHHETASLHLPHLPCLRPAWRRRRQDTRCTSFCSPSVRYSTRSASGASSAWTRRR